MHRDLLPQPCRNPTTAAAAVPQKKGLLLQLQSQHFHCGPCHLQPWGLRADSTCSCLAWLDFPDLIMSL